MTRHALPMDSGARRAGTSDADTSVSSGAPRVLLCFLCLWCVVCVVPAAEYARPRLRMPIRQNLFATPFLFSIVFEAPFEVGTSACHMPNARRKTCGRTTTDNRVDAAVIRDLAIRNLKTTHIFWECREWGNRVHVVHMPPAVGGAACLALWLPRVSRRVWLGALPPSLSVGGRRLRAQPFRPRRRTRGRRHRPVRRAPSLLMHLALFTNTRDCAPSPFTTTRECAPSPLNNTRELRALPFLEQQEIVHLPLLIIQGECAPSLHGACSYASCVLVLVPGVACF